MKPFFYITAIKEESSSVILPDSFSPGHVNCEYTIQVEGSGDFSKYVTDKGLNKIKLLEDVLAGKVKLKGIKK